MSARAALGLSDSAAHSQLAETKGGISGWTLSSKSSGAHNCNKPAKRRSKEVIVQNTRLAKNRRLENMCKNIYIYINIHVRKDTLAHLEKHALRYKRRTRWGSSACCLWWISSSSQQSAKHWQFVKMLSVMLGCWPQLIISKAWGGQRPGPEPGQGPGITITVII